MKLCYSTVALVSELSYNHIQVQTHVHRSLHNHTKKKHTEKLLKAFKNLFLKYFPEKLL